MGKVISWVVICGLVLFSFGVAQYSPPPNPTTGGTCGGLGGDVTGTCGANTVTKINGSTPATIATSGSASDLGTGTLPPGRIGAASIDLTAKVTGALPPANGGTGLTGFTSGGIPCATSSSVLAFSSLLTSKLMLQGGGAGVCPSATNNVFVYSNGTTAPAIFLPNASFPATNIINAGATGDIDVYTVPAGRRLVCYSQIIATNFSGGSINAYAELKSGGVYYPLAPAATITNNSSGSGSFIVNTPATNMFLSGETVSFNISATGLSLWWRCVEFDNSGALNRTALITPAAGDNTIYTVVGNSYPINLVFYNGSGGTRTYNVFLVPSGGGTANANKVINGGSLTAAAKIVAATTFATGSVLANGDFISLNDDANTATQVVWVTYVQIP